MHAGKMSKAQRELLKSPVFIDSIFHTTGVGIAVLDEKGRYVKTNDGYTQMLGYKSGELDGKLFTYSAPPGRKVEYHDVLTRLMSGEEGSEERLAIRKNRREFSVFRTTKLFINPDGSKNLLVTIRDNSEVISFRNLLQNTERVAGIAGWELDLATGKITRTDELFNIFEISKSDPDKLSLEDKLTTLYHPEFRMVFKKAFQEAIQQGKSFDLELSITTGSGKKKWVRITCTPEQFKHKTVKLIGTVHDITRQKETSVQLERLSLVASKTNNAVFITDHKGKTVWINESVENLTGYKKAEFIGKSPGKVLQGPDTNKEVVVRISKHLKKRLPVSEIIKYYKKDGSTFWIKMDITPVIKNNKLENFIGIGIDVSELVHARESEKRKEILEKQQQLFNSIANHFPDGIIGVLDNSLHYIFVGGAELKKLGINNRQWIGSGLFDQFTPISDATSDPFLARVLAGESVIFEASMFGQIYSVNAVPLMRVPGEKMQTLVVLYNITQRKKAEEEVINALGQQRELNELKSKFVSIASHEFRTPLSTILSSTFLISKYTHSQEHDKAQKHLERIEMAVHALTDILNDFLSLGRIEEGKLTNNITSFNIIEFFDALTDEIQSLLKKGQHLICHHEGEADVFTLDRQHLKNVLVNLISNASKYSAEGKTIWLDSSLRKGEMSFVLRDEGIGIPLIDQPRLFQTFFRAHNVDHIQGTGMGLHIVKRFLDLMGGTIRFTSEEHKGSIFRIRFATNLQ
jgi:PAS domain S-box-containing protein